MENDQKPDWSIIYTDTFDRGTPPQIEKTGKGLEPSVFYLWQYTLFESIDRNGRKGFTDFHVLYHPAGDVFLPDNRSAGLKICLEPPYQPILKLLRQWIFDDNNRSREDYREGGLELLKLLSRYHYLLIKNLLAERKTVSLYETSEEVLKRISEFREKREVEYYLKESIIGLNIRP
jgi:hypothetical protein